MIQTYYPQKLISSYIIGMLAAFLLIPGAFLLKDENYYGLILIGIWLSLFTIRSGVKIDYQKKVIQVFKEYLWIRFNIPKNSKSYTGYRIKRVSESYSFSTKIQSSKISQEFHSIELFNDKTHKFERIALGNLETIKSIADRIEKEFEIRRIIKNTSR